jgi:hypothetical protein
MRNGEESLNINASRQCHKSIHNTALFYAVEAIDAGQCGPAGRQKSPADENSGASEGGKAKPQ